MNTPLSPATDDDHAPLFDLQRVSVSYGELRALKEISLQVEVGEKVALIGPSGAGKSTLLNKLYRLRTAETALIHQHYALVPQLSVFHNVYIGQLDRHPFLFNVLNLARPQRRKLAEITPILEHLGLADKAQVRVGELSGGQQQRVAVGRALYRGGQILLADEPVASLDMHQGEAILRLIMDREQTVICSLHSVDFARQFAQRMVGLREGSILFDLPSAQVTQEMLDSLYQPC